MPMSALMDTINFFHRTFECYPLWFCPHRLYRVEPQGMLRAPRGSGEYEMYVDVGAWFAPGKVRGRAPRCLARVFVCVCSCVCARVCVGAPRVISCLRACT